MSEFGPGPTPEQTGEGVSTEPTMSAKKALELADELRGKISEKSEQGIRSWAERVRSLEEDLDDPENNESDVRGIRTLLEREQQVFEGHILSHVKIDLRERGHSTDLI